MVEALLLVASRVGGLRGRARRRLRGYPLWFWLEKPTSRRSDVGPRLVCCPSEKQVLRLRCAPLRMTLLFREQSSRDRDFLCGWWFQRLGDDSIFTLGADVVGYVLRRYESVRVRGRGIGDAELAGVARRWSSQRRSRGVPGRRAVRVRVRRWLRHGLNMRSPRW